MSRGGVQVKPSTNLASVNLADSWNLSHVRDRVIKEQKIDQAKAERLEREYRRFMSVIAAQPGQRFPISRKVDPFWHAHILFTVDYSRFCASINRGRFIHHEPMSAGVKPDEVRASYSRFRQLYVEAYGQEPPKEFWPLRLQVGANAECGGGDCESNCVQCR